MRRELTVTQSMKRYNEVVNKLAAKEIPYTVRVVDHANPSSFFSAAFGGSRRARTGTFAEQRDRQLSYYIYVKKKDLELARYTMNR